MHCDAMPTVSDTRAPETRRAKTSRPGMPVARQREHSGPSRSLGEAPEEIHPRRCKPDRGLIDEKRDGAALAKRTRNAANGDFIMDDIEPDLLARFRQVSIDKRIRHVSGNDGD